MDGALPNLDFVEEAVCLNLLPYARLVPEGFAGRNADLGVCRWDHIVLGISARSHVDAATLRRALERMDASPRARSLA